MSSKPVKDASMAEPTELDLGQIAELSTIPEEERKTLRKIDFYIIPIMGITYMLSYMDKVTLSNASIMGIVKDTGLKGTDFSWCSSIFYFGYLFWTWPSSYLIVRFPIGKYLSCIVAIWGMVLMCHAACHNFTSLMIARFFLGVAEAGISPGFALVVSMFYKRREQPSRQNAWVSGNGFGNIINGVISYGIAQITTAAITSWKILFLIFGGITIAWAIVLFLLLPSSPATAVFLDEGQRKIAVHRIAENKTGVSDEDKYKVEQVWQALRDPQTWLMTFYMLAINMPNGAITSFSGLIISGFGFSTLATLLLSIPAGVVQLILLAATAAVTLTFRNSRMMCMVAMNLLAVVGSIVIYVVPVNEKAARLVGVYLTVALSINTPLMLSLVSANIAGFTKRSTVSAILFLGYAAGNIIGPQFFLSSEAPTYTTGLCALTICLSIALAVTVLLLTYYVLENRRRDKRDQAEGVSQTATEHADVLANLTDRELRSFRYVI